MDSQTVALLPESKLSKLKTPKNSIQGKQARELGCLSVLGGFSLVNRLKGRFVFIHCGYLRSSSVSLTFRILSMSFTAGREVSAVVGATPSLSAHNPVPMQVGPLSSATEDVEVHPPSSNAAGFLSFEAFTECAFVPLKEFLLKYGDNNRLPKAKAEKEAARGRLTALMSTTPCSDWSADDVEFLASMVAPAHQATVQARWATALGVVTAMAPAYLELTGRFAATKARLAGDLNQVQADHTLQMAAQAAAEIRRRAESAAGVGMAPEGGSEEGPPMSAVPAQLGGAGGPAAAAVVAPTKTVPAARGFTLGVGKGITAGGRTKLLLGPKAKQQAKSGKSAFPTLQMASPASASTVATAASPSALPRGTFMSPACNPRRHPSPYTPLAASDSDDESIETDSTGSTAPRAAQSHACGATLMGSVAQPASPHTALDLWTQQQGVTARQLTTTSPAAFFATVVLGSGFGFFGITGSIHVLKGRMSSSDKLTFTITAVTGPLGGPPTSAVHADGAGLCLIPRSLADMEEFFRVMVDVMFGDGEAPGVDFEERLKLMAIFEMFTRTFRRRATALLGSMGDGPWHGHPTSVPSGCGSICSCCCIARWPTPCWSTRTFPS